MNIIEISEIMELTTRNNVMAIGIPIIISFIGVLLSSFLIKRTNHSKWALVGVIAFFLGIIIEVFILTYPTEHTGKYNYVAVLDKSYSAIELFENYTNISYDTENNLFYFSDK